jgi:CRISPR/Cas system CSM-associated protein Csm3 (group 7 of RAMP superfamily)
MQTQKQYSEAETTMHGTITETETELTIDATVTEAEPMPIEQWPRKKRNVYLGKLRLLGTIRANIADALNAKREAAYKAFFMPSDKYIPQDKDNAECVKLALGKQ